MSEQRELIVNGEKRIILQQGETLFQAILRSGAEGSFCGGIGLCGKCRIRFHSAAPLPTAADRRFFHPDELRQGCRLACMVREEQLSESVIEVDTLFPHAVSYPILSEYQADIRQILGGAVAEKPGTEEKDAMSLADKENYTIVDIGTTTIVMQRIESKRGRCLIEYRSLNPQRRYGSDVISRIQAAMNGKAQELQELIQNEILKGLLQMDQKCGRASRVIIAANTTMACLFQGVDVTPLSQAPFTIPRELKREYELKEYRIMMYPGASAFVGGDVMAGAVALNMHQEQKMQLLIDLGTNGEIVLGNREQFYVTSVAAGPAFENSKSFELPGSDWIRVIAQMLRQGVIDETGLLKESYFEDGYLVGTVRIVQEDIREIQKAKAAVFTGIKTLLAKAEISPEQIEHVYLAGGFGQGLSVESAIQIGLFPKELYDRVKAVGNTALAGAYLYGLAEAHGEARQYLPDKMLDCCQSVNLAQETQFTERYIEAMNFIY